MEVICPFTPDPFYAVGMWYQDFSEVSDREVQELFDPGRGSTTYVRPRSTRGLE